MFIRKKPSGKYKYIEIVETYWDPTTKMPRTTVIEKIGRLDKLLAEDPEVMQKLEEKVKGMNGDAEKKRAAERRKTIEQFLSEGKTEETKEGCPVRNYGYVIYKKIWDELKIERTLQEEQRKNSKAEYEMGAVTFLLTIGRIMNPASKQRTYLEQKNYLGMKKVDDLNQVYRALDVLQKSKTAIEKHLDKQIRKQYGREINVAFYDVTTFAFQSVEKDSLKQFGYSKDQKFNEVQVVLGLFMDKNGIPVGYELFPGNTSDFSTMQTALESLKGKYKIKKVIITADRGLNSKKNLKMIREMGYGYVMASKIRGASEEIKEMVLSEEGYTAVRDDFKYKVYPYQNIIKDGKEEQSFSENLIVTWSKARQEKDAADRKRLVDKAIKLVESPAQYHAEMKKGGRKYVQTAIQGKGLQVNYAQIEYDASFDGYYSIETSETMADPEEIIDIYKGLWKIEETFRVMKSNLESRPCFVWTESRIKGHFVSCFIALTIQRIIEFRLRQANCNAGTTQIIDAVRSANVMIVNENSRPVFFKAVNDSLYDEMIRILEIGSLYTSNSRKDIHDMIALRV